MMIDPKEYLVVIGPKKGACYVCGKDLERTPSLQVQVNVPLTKFKKVAGRACTTCSSEFRALLDLRIQQAAAGEYQA
mgnify:CR=1 FL=1